MFHQDEFKNTQPNTWAWIPCTWKIHGHIGAQHSRLHTTSHWKKDKMNIVGMDVFSRLMMDRIIFMGVPVNDYVANVIQAQCCFWNLPIPKETFKCLSIARRKCDRRHGHLWYHAVCGAGCSYHFVPDLPASMGAVLLVTGKKEENLYNTAELWSTSLQVAYGSQLPTWRFYNLIKTLRKELYDILAFHTGKTFEDIEKDSERR